MNRSHLPGPQASPKVKKSCGLSRPRTGRRPSNPTPNFVTGRRPSNPTPYVTSPLGCLSSIPESYIDASPLQQNERQKAAETIQDDPWRFQQKQARSATLSEERNTSAEGAEGTERAEKVKELPSDDAMMDQLRRQLSFQVLHEAEKESVQDRELELAVLRLIQIQEEEDRTRSSSVSILKRQRACRDFNTQTFYIPRSAGVNKLRPRSKSDGAVASLHSRCDPSISKAVKHENMCLSPSSTHQFSFVLSQPSQPAQPSQPPQPPHLPHPCVPSVLMDTSSSTQDSRAITRVDGDRFGGELEEPRVHVETSGDYGLAGGVFMLDDFSLDLPRLGSCGELELSVLDKGNNYQVGLELQRLREQDSGRRRRPPTLLHVLGMNTSS